MTWEEACRILGVPVTAAPAEIKTQWLYKANLFHPDKTANLPESMREKAEDDFKQASAAYDFLKDLKNNPYTTPPKLDIRVRHIRFKDLETGQKKSTSFEIKSTGGPYTRFWIDDAAAPWLRVTDIKSTTNEPLPLEVTVEATGMGQPGQQAQCRLLIRLENEKTKSRDEKVIPVEIVMRKAQKPRLEHTQDLNPRIQPPPTLPARPVLKQKFAFLYFFIVCLVLIIVIAVLQYRGS
ncbi:MAG: hypothetical protein C4542_01125 [Dehalococcoidia bacterium]|nr:MAG: hypothetical protein C4542_01125 [Dehalococcoidia bacterium]